MASKLIGILLLAALLALVPAQAHGPVRKTTLDKVERLLKATDLDDSRDETMLAIEQLANSLSGGSFWLTCSPKHILEMLVEVYKANKANEASYGNSANMDCGGKTEMAARTLYEAVMDAATIARCKTFANYTSAELKKYATACANTLIDESKLSINLLNATVRGRIRTLAQHVLDRYDSPYAQAIYDYMVEQTGKEDDPDARYLKLFIDPKKQDATTNNKKLSELREKYVTSTCTAYLDTAGPALSKAQWARDVLAYPKVWSPMKTSDIYGEILDYTMGYKICRQALERPILSIPSIAYVIRG